MRNTRKTIFILIGPKGSGKTCIGSLLQQELGIPFFRVENTWLNVKEERFSDRYVKKGFSLVEREIDRRCKDTDRVEEINRMALSADLSFDLVIRNKQETDEEIKEAFSSILFEQ